jgi:probable rRNA maturation factor
MNINIAHYVWQNTDGFAHWQNSLFDIFSKTVEKVYDGKRKFLIDILLTDDKNIQELNKTFRSKNTSTNVMSFPQYESEDIRLIDEIHKGRNVMLGDIAMSYENIMRESKKFNFNFFDRCSHLFVHGVLHLFGMDHINLESESKMERLEIEILEGFGMRNPYILNGE